MVRGDDIEEMDALFLCVKGMEESVAILVEGLEVQVADPAQDPALQHERFGGRHFDAQFLADTLHKDGQILLGLGDADLVGATLGLNFQAGSLPVSTRLKYFHEFNAENRAEGDAAFVTLSMPL